MVIKFIKLNWFKFLSNIGIISLKNLIYQTYYFLYVFDPIFFMHVNKITFFKISP